MKSKSPIHLLLLVLALAICTGSASAQSFETTITLTCDRAVALGSVNVSLKLDNGVEVGSAALACGQNTADGRSAKATVTTGEPATQASWVSNGVCQVPLQPEPLPVRVNCIRGKLTISRSR